MPYALKSLLLAVWGLESFVGDEGCGIGRAVWLSWDWSSLLDSGRPWVLGGAQTGWELRNHILEGCAGLSVVGSESSFPWFLTLKYVPLRGAYSQISTTG